MNPQTLLIRREGASEAACNQSSFPVPRTRFSSSPPVTMKKIFSILACAVFPLAAFAQDNAASDNVKLAQAQSDKYTAAFDKGDVQALSDLYSDDVEYTTETGVQIFGRKTVVDGLAKYFAKNKGAKLELHTESARLLSPDVLSEKGLSSLTSAKGSSEFTRYTVTYVKKGDAWLITQVGETAPPAVNAAVQALGELEWMVGSWNDNSPGITVETQVAWTKQNHFLRRSFSVTREGQNTVDGTEVIGYDPVQGRLRSWVFDSQGGFGEGLWTQEGNKWLVNMKATGPDGSQSTSQHVITKVDDNKYTWESINRARDGEVLPNLDKIEVVRTPAK
jgi:uncharacterized protein (TIGR02246 family)